MPREKTAPVLLVEGVHKRFERRSLLGGVTKEVLAGVNLRVGEAETVGLVGASGVGKSTLARMIVGLSAPDAGRIVIAGEDLYGVSGRRRKATLGSIYMIFQDPYDSLAPHLTVRQLVAEPLRLQGAAAATLASRIEPALAEVGLPIARFGDRHPHQLSGGERQRVALARALALRPRLIVADEPTSMVDFSMRRELLDLMAGCRGRHGIAFVYVTHDVLLARRFCDRIAVMFNGQIVEDGPSARVLEEPSHPYTARLVAAARQINRFA